VDWTVDPDAERPPSRQLLDAVLDALARGELVAGDQLPSVRALAAEALVNHNTVARAWRDLEQLGVTRGRNGRGVFVTADGPQIASEMRLEETLIAFRQAAADALRSGHSAIDLERILRAARERKRA